MSNKITEAQFKVLEEIRNGSLEVATSLGELHYQKAMLDLQIDEQKEKIKLLRDKEAKFFDELNRLYGNVVLNIETGELTPRV